MPQYSWQLNLVAEFVIINVFVTLSKRDTIFHTLSKLDIPWNHPHFHPIVVCSVMKLDKGSLIRVTTFGDFSTYLVPITQRSITIFTVMKRVNGWEIVVSAIELTIRPVGGFFTRIAVR
ncbi:hypothetical protein [Halococcus thailandensis]|uniref:Uncharacterized protein n=1 Tax=Halococcus thailandensis JCM 13552 TaxID=1227457 RepID=M0N9T6_9EURY|nr:hypothetical protein [Halococcus thailandensis]EMA53864.1 hypothetical protein C451_08805 [Halococcus thailandensis JCM 13552]